MEGLYLTYYDEATSMSVLIVWQGAMKGKLESLYSNVVWVPVEAPKGIKLIDISKSIRGTKE